MFILEKLNVVKLTESKDKKNKLLADGYKLKETKPEKQMEEQEVHPDNGEEQEKLPVSEQIEKENGAKKNK